MRLAQPPRHHAIDLLKGIAIIAVILIHFMGGLKVGIEMAGWYTTSWIVINQILRFSVPLFVVLSGYSLTHKYEHHQFKLKEFFAGRVTKLIPLYLLWVAVILTTVYLVPGWRGFAEDYPFWKQVLFGRAEYHLYFVPMIFQLYLLFPLFLWVVKRFPLVAVALAGIVQAGIFMLISSDKTAGFTALLSSDQGQYIWFASWIFYFVLGMALRVTGFRSRWFIGLTVAGLFWSIADALITFGHGVDIILAGRFTRWPIAVYNLGLAGATIGFKDRLEAWTQSGFSWLIAIGKQSFLIYLFHTLALRLCMGIWRNQISFGYSLFVVTMLCVGVFFSKKLFRA
jgi:probable poly-beta-1,6-N-acetyl-D-glucosamine export protein